MNRNCLLNKALALLLCAVLLIGYLPVSALPAAAATSDDWESEKDILETTTEAPTEPEAEETVKTITFDDTAKRTVITTEQQVWVENGITVTNDKASSTSNVNGQYYNPARFYKNSTVTVDCPGMTKIVWDSSASTQAGYLKTSIEKAADSNVTVSVSGQIVTIEFAEPVDTFLVTCSGGQCRATSMEIHVASEPETTEPETTEPETTEPETTEPETTEPETTEPEVESEPVKYVIWSAADNKAMTALGSSKTYGYLPATDVTPDDYYAPVGYVIENIFTLIQNGENYYIVDSYGRYLYMTGTYNSYNVSATLPAEGAEWKLTDLGDGTYHITNVLKSKTVSYGSSYNTFGAYASAPFSAMTLYEIPGYTADNPVFLFETEKTVINDGTMYYATRQSATMVVSGEGDFSVTYNGETLTAVDGAVEVEVAAASMWEPASFTLNGTGEYTIKFVYPEGTQMNPAELTLGYNDTAIEAGNAQGYYYKWTATENGTLSFNIETITEGVEADIVINNYTSYANRTLLADGVENDFGVMVVSMPVTAGDEIEVQIAVMPDANWAYPAADINHYSEFTYPVGSEMNPVWLYDQENTVTVPAGATVYYQGRFNGMNLTVSGATGFAVVYNGENLTDVEGTASTAVVAPGFMMPVVFAIANNTESEQTYSIKFVYPVGSFENPAAAVLGDNTCSIEAGNSQGYFWTYTAEQTGDLIVEIKAQTGWSYVVNNMTTYQYGDTQWSDSDPVVNPDTIAVNQGDEIQIIVNTYDPNAENPAGDITVNLSYKQDAQPEVELKIQGLSLALQSDLSVGFTVNPAMFADGAYTDLRMEFRLGDENAEPVVVTDYILLSNGNRVYMFNGIAPRMLNETVYAKLYGTYMGTEYSAATSTSIYTYCNWALSGSDAKLKTLAVDLMNYASAHQIYGNYKTDTLANRNLTPEQQALGTQTDPARTNITNASQAVIANPTASFTGAALYLQNKVEIRFTFSVPALTENTRLVVVVDGETVSYGADKFVANGSKYYVDVDALAAKQMRSAVDATLYEGDTAISNTLRYSIESFVAWAYGREGFSSDALDAMMITMLKYGDSANAFFN